MPQSEYRVYAGTTALTDDQLGLIGDIRVDQAIGMAAEAEVTFPVTTDDNGLWSVLEESWVQPFKRLRDSRLQIERVQPIQQEQAADQIVTPSRKTPSEPSHSALFKRMIFGGSGSSFSRS